MIRSAFGIGALAMLAGLSVLWYRQLAPNKDEIASAKSAEGEAHGNRLSTDETGSLPPMAPPSDRRTAIPEHLAPANPMWPGTPVAPRQPEPQVPAGTARETGQELRQTGVDQGALQSENRIAELVPLDREGSSQPGTMAEPKVASVEKRTHVVQAGDSLWRISRTYYGSAEFVNVIARTNGLGSDDRLLPGKTLLLPVVAGGRPPSPPADADHERTVQAEEPQPQDSEPRLAKDFEPMPPSDSTTMPLDAIMP